MEFVNLPDIQFTDQQVQSIKDAVLTSIEAKTGRTMNRADPDRIFMLALVDEIIQLRVLIDQVKKGDLLKYARGGALEHLGAFYNVYRLDAEAARTTIRFTLSMPLTSPQTIPAGTRVGVQNSGGAMYFSTTEAAVIPAGGTVKDISAAASVTGTAGNGFIPGQVNTIMDPLPYVQSAVNVTESAGGADVESDEALRTRIRLAPESFSAAGPREGYIYWAKTASPAIIDVAAVSPADREVLVIPLLQGGELPTQDIIYQVSAAVNDRAVRPLTDHVTVQAPEVVPYDITLTYYISSSNVAAETTIQAAVNKAIDEYRLWQKSKLGRDINPSELIWRVKSAGALRVDVSAPTNIEVSELQVAQEGNVNITYGGLADD
ncbi:phage-related baseplate assembly protein [Paenibacillus rhizosphaerae]|uniref:Phage-related baseplate assembly protein n=1 Tax=Paenibacillus rhizosphaerae TaxID=297318 RepID=A0A839U321_9BACL|nr:baseplate J/gp47 family protein [Paenibacillus rhizosphaerae]MBB3132130.1 phage-related baseplate assembly protein [Paenibacillus rhizosphaerae]